MYLFLFPNSTSNSRAVIKIKYLRISTSLFHSKKKKQPLRRHSYRTKSTKVTIFILFHSWSHNNPHFRGKWEPHKWGRKILTQRGLRFKVWEVKNVFSLLQESHTYGCIWHINSSCISLHQLPLHWMYLIISFSCLLTKILCIPITNPSG